MRDEEARTREPGVVVALPVVGGGNRHVIGFALDDDERVVAVGPVLCRAPNHEIRARVPGTASGDFNLLVHLLKCEAVFVHEDAKVFLPHALFRRFLQSLFADVAPDFSFFAADGE